MIVITDTVNFRHIANAVASSMSMTLQMFNSNGTSFKITPKYSGNTEFTFIAEATNGDCYEMDVVDGGYRMRNMETGEFVTKFLPIGNCTFEIYSH